MVYISFLIPRRNLLFVCSFYRWEDWGLGMLSDLPKEHVEKASGFESPVLSGYMRTRSFIVCKVNYDNFQLHRRALLITLPLSSGLLSSGFRLPLLYFSGLALLSKLCFIHLFCSNSSPTLAAHCFGPWPMLTFIVLTLFTFFSSWPASQLLKIMSSICISSTEHIVGICVFYLFNYIHSFIQYSTECLSTVPVPELDPETKDDQATSGLWRGIDQEFHCEASVLI